MRFSVPLPSQGSLVFSSFPFFCIFFFPLTLFLLAFSSDSPPSGLTLSGRDFWSLFGSRSPHFPFAGFSPPNPRIPLCVIRRHPQLTDQTFSCFPLYVVPTFSTSNFHSRRTKRVPLEAPHSPRRGSSIPLSCIFTRLGAFFSLRYRPSKGKFFPLLRRLRSQERFRLSAFFSDKALRSPAVVFFPLFFFF